MFPVGRYKGMISCHDSISAIESSAWLVFDWLAPARHSKTSHGDGGFVYNKKRSHTQLDSRKQVIAFQDRVITINIKEAQHPLK